ncbi:hypothetical protein JZ751_022803 [Albula glossodonta]|uniref:RING-type E3 ubiquitin transferase n=1 Tax=Albula glossodonta TaxID=121402 RepID=A0A8T2PMD9_9TELE|nr:hypothetical protein JZ751_022803 [Albula glossodonta]
MSDSDGDPDFDEYPDEVPHRAKRAYEKNSSAPKSTLDTFERWRLIPSHTKKKTCHMMHMCVFWWHILLRQQDKSSTTQWAVQVGFLDNHVTGDLSLKRLYKIEVLESILRALEKGCLSDELTKQLVFLGNQFGLSQQADCVDEAVRFLEKTGEPDIASQIQRLGCLRIRFLTLSFVFSEYAQYVQAMAYNKEEMMTQLDTANCRCCVQRSEEMKNKGNELFQKRKYDAAVKWYTKAIKYYPENYILYGNRALCFIRSEKYQKAIGDGKRATIIQPSWAKGHYRFCDALFSLGEHKRALEANERAQELCYRDAEGIRDLQQQRGRFLSEMEESKGSGKRKKIGAKKDSSKRLDSVPRTGVERPHNTESSSRSEHTSDSSATEHKEPDEGSGCIENPVTAERRAQTEQNKEPAEMKSEMTGKKNRKTDPFATEKQLKRTRHPPPQEKMGDSSDSGNLLAKLSSAVQDAQTALTDQRCRNAEHAFSQALHVLDSTVPKELGISELDVAILKYGHATALIEIGQPEELAEAKEEFHSIQKTTARTLQCLIFYGIGKVWLKENRFSVALEHFSDALVMVKRQITPGKLTWPTTKAVIEETQPEYLKGRLEECIEMCMFPPKPDGVCRHQKCQGHSKIEIYFTDPDFKGFIRMVCCQSCNVEFHISCWKKMKAAMFSDKNDKDFLQETCFTPDCGGKICHIVIFGSTGLIKCEFESSIQKTKVTAKTRVKQKCTSWKKLKSKEDRKLRRKQHRQAASEAIQEGTKLVPLDKSVMSAVEPQEKASQAWLFYGDRVLHQIFENKELLKEETHDISAFIKCLLPWRERERGEENAVQSFKEPESFGDVVDFLLERKNRVWARIFIQLLSTLDISPKLHDWACRLDSAGLKAAESFIERYAEHLEELNLAPLLAFPPMQDVLIEKFGSVPEIFHFTVTDFLKQAPPQEVRLFIWTLEENRELYPSFHHALDEYFELMDGLCLVIKKTEHENKINSPIKGKNRGRKKKQKEPKSVILLSGTRGGTLGEDDDEDIFFEDDSLMLLDSSDPFSVPNHLRDQVAEFEGQYVGAPGSHYRRILDNNPDPTKESLYDYFEQVLEEHGPMEVSNQLLVGELENFPSEAQLKIQEAGGLQTFLQESLRFVMMDNLIGLMKHAVSLQEVTDDPMAELHCVSTPSVEEVKGPTLNPSAKEFQPLFQTPTQGDGDAGASLGHAAVMSDLAQVLPQPGCFDFASDAVYSSSDITEMFSTCPEPFVYDPSVNSNFHFAAVPSEMYDSERTFLSDSPTPYLGAFNNPSIDIQSHNKKTDSTVKKEAVNQCNNSVGQSSKRPVCKNVNTQVFPECKDHVAVNTEPYELFETNKGDMIKKEKDNLEFEKQMHQMMEDYEKEEQKREEEISSLEKELDSLRQNTEITNKEVELFQQELEKEVKKDQQEKKENQETLKALKSEIKELSDSHETFSKDIREKNKEYDKHLNDFLERSNQSATEKMSLEDEIKRCRDLCAEATRRSQAAEISILENRRQRGLRGLNKCVSDGEMILAKVKDMATRFPSSGLHLAAEEWQAYVWDVKEKILKTKSQYKEQMELLKKGNRLCTLPVVPVPTASPPPPMPVMPVAPVISDPSVVRVVYPVHPARQPNLQQYFMPYGVTMPMAHRLQQQKGPRVPSASPPVQTEDPVGKLGQADQISQVSPLPPATQTNTQTTGNSQSHAVVRPAAPLLSQGPRAGVQQHSNVFEKIIDRLNNMFPHYSRSTLTKFIQEVRVANGGCLNNLSYEEVINRVAQLILDHQDNTREQMSSTHRPEPGAFGVQVSRTPPPRSDSPAATRAANTPPPSHVWKSVGVQNTKWAKSKALNVEDPCIICHEEMAQEELCVLECRHSFHRECIKSWLKEQSTCPTCREHALLPEDFPLLPGRIRRGHTPAAPSS